MRRWVQYILAAILAWLVLLVLISTMPVWSGFFSWNQSLWMTLHQWTPWMLLSPVIIWFALRFPIEWTGWKWRLLVHLAVGVLFITTCAWIHEYAFAPPQHAFDRAQAGGQFEAAPPPFEPQPGQGGGDARFAGAGRREPPREMDQNVRLMDRPPPMGPGWHRPPLWARAGFNVPIYLALVGVCHAFIYFRRAQQRDRRALELETQLGQARLQALRMQLQPHFLFNTLNAISTLVQTNPQAAQEMIGSLGQMLRLSLDSGPDPEVPLEQELKFLDCYLEIAQVRFGNRLRVRRDIAPATGPALVPTFILQPLVENAVRHGIEPSLTPGVIEIAVRQDAGRLFIAIRDSGVGLAEGEENESSPNGIGIANTKARLQSLYPGGHRFSVRNVAAGGCVAELEIPFHTGPLTPAGNGSAA